MADAQETQAQLQFQQEINKVLQARMGIFAAQEKALSSQVQLAVDMCKALKCEELDKVEDRLKGSREAMEAAAREAARLKGGLDGVAAAGQEAGKKTAQGARETEGAFSKSNLTLAGFGLGIMQFGGIFMQTFKNVISTAGGLVETLARVGFAIFTLPFKLLGNLMDLAQSSGGGGPSPTALALEKIRVELGGLNTAVGKSAASSLPQFRAQLRDMAKTGLSVRKVFGQGREGLAKAMEYNLELFKALGPVASSFAGVLKKNAVELAMYRKGLGITAESQAQIMKLAEASGKDPVKAMHGFATMAINMGDMFGESAAAIGKDMAEMKADFANFGTLSVRELGQAAVYARKLGIAIKDLQGLIGAFDDFETAAQNAAKLSQSFNMNVDAMKMLNAQNPAERLSMLQKAFRETGKSVDQMSRQELKLLAAQSGLTEEAAMLAFSQKGLAMSYDQIQKAGGKAEKKQLTQAEAMSKLADSIERVFGSGGGNKFQGFFDAFAKGFQRGILRSVELRRLFRDIRQSLRKMYWAGVSVGRMFAEMFPGIQTMIKGLRDLFNPAKWGVMIEKIKVIFKDFFTDLQTDPKAGAKKFIENMKNLFKDFFGQKGGAIETIVEGGKTFLKTIGAIFMAVAPMVLDAFVDAINAIADFIEKPPRVPAAVSALGDQLLDALIRVFDVLKDRLWPPLKRMFTAIWDKVGADIERTLWRIFAVSLFKAFARGVIGALGGAAISLLTTKLQMIMKTAAGVTPPDTPGKPTDPAAMTRKLPSLWTFLGAVLILLGAFIAVVAIYRAFNLKPEDAVGIGLLLVAITGAAVGMSYALKLAPDVDFETLASKATGIGLLLGMMIVVVGIAAAVYKAASITLDQALGLSIVLLAVTAAGIGLAFALQLAPDVNWKQMLTKVLGIAGLLLAAGVAVAAVVEVISMTKAPSIAQITAWAAVMGVLVLSSLPLIGAAALVAKLPAGEAFKGLAILGIFMLAVGGLGRIISGMLSSVPDPTGVGILMAGISAIMLSTVAMLPVAIALGLLLSGPQAAVLAAAPTGMAALAGFMSMMVDTLMPVIDKLSQIRLTDPRSFAAVTEALLSIMQATNEFIGALTGLAIVLKPVGDDVKPEAFATNIGTFSSMVEKILDSGVNQILNKLMAFAQGANIADGAADAIEAIASVFGAIAAFMKAFSPDGAVLQAMAGNSNSTDAMMLLAGPPGMVAYAASLIGRAHAQSQLLDSLKTFQSVSASSFKAAMPVIVSGITTLLGSLSNIPAGAKDVAPFVSSLASVLGAVATLMKALSPSDAAMKAVEEAADTMGEDPGILLDKMFEKLGSINLAKVLEDLKKPIGDLMDAIATSLGPLLTSAQAINKDALSAVTGALSSVMSFVGGMMETFRTMMEQADKISSAQKDGASQQSTFTTTMTNLNRDFSNFGEALGKLAEPMSAMIGSIIGVARSIGDRDVKGLKSKVELIGSMLGIVTVMGDIMKSVPAGYGAGGAYESGPQRLLIFMQRFTTDTGENSATKLFEPGGVMQKFVNLIKGINVDPSVSKKAAGIKSAVDAVSALGVAFSSSGGLKQLTDIGSTVDSLDKAIQHLTKRGETSRSNILTRMASLINTSVPTVADKTTAISSMFAQVNQLISSMNGLGAGAEKINGVVELGNALAGTKTVTVKHEKVNITMNITVKVGAAEVAKAIIETNDSPAFKAISPQRFQTTPT